MFYKFVDVMKLLKKVIDKIRDRFLSDEEYARRIGVKIGKHCYISTRRFPSEAYLISIGDYVRIAPNTMFFTHGGLWSIRKKYKDKNIDYFGKITIGDYTYIGEGCMIMPGVTIGTNVIIGAGSVVTKSVPDNCMVAGNPIKYIGNTEAFYEKIKLHNIGTSGLSFEEKREKLLKLEEDSFVVKPYINFLPK